MLQKYPDAVRAADDPKAIATRYVVPTSNCVLVFTEYGIPDPLDAPGTFDNVVESLRRLPGVADAGWESINAAVACFYIDTEDEPFHGLR